MITSSGLKSKADFISCKQPCTLAVGKSILFKTGIIVKLASRAKKKFAIVCADRKIREISFEIANKPWTPCDASITNKTPWHAANARDTS